MDMNPILPPQIHMADGEAHVINGEVYLYGSNDVSEGKFCSGEYYVAHSKDLQQWEIEGPVFTAEQAHWAGEAKVHSSVRNVTCFDDLPEHIKRYLPEESRNLPIGVIIKAIQENAAANLPGEKLLYAPDAAHKDGRTYLFFCLSDDTEGVASGQAPAGPFGNAGQLCYERSGKAVTGIDPAVFLDEDGVGYYYWGQFQANAAVLTDDFGSIRDETVVEGIVTEKEHHFHEGSSLRKRGDWYYYVFADVSRGKPTCLGYAMGKSPLGPFSYKGVIIDNAKCAPGSWNNHGSIEEINGQWYVFYHKSAGKNQYMRRVCAEPIYFDENGLIAEVTPTSQGAGRPFGTGEDIPGYTACELDGTAYVSDGNQDSLLIFEQGSGAAVFRYVESPAGANRITLRSRGKGKVRVFCDSMEAGAGELGEEDIPVTIGQGLHEITLEIYAEDIVEIEKIVI